MKLFWVLDVDGADEEPYVFAKQLLILLKIFALSSGRSRVHATEHYDKEVSEAEYQDGGRVLFWNRGSSTKDRNEILRPWVGPYVVTGKLRAEKYMLKSDVENCVVRVRVSHSKKLGNSATKIGDPKDGIFSDSMHIFHTISE